MDIAKLGFDIDSSDLKKGEKDLKNLTNSSKKAEQAAKGFGVTAPNAARKVAAANDNAAKSAGRLSNSYKKIAGSMKLLAVAALSFLAAATSIKTFVNNTIESEDALTQLNNVLKSTRGAAGLTASELTNMASELQKVTRFGDEAIIPAQSLLLTFTKVGKTVFPRALEAILDVSTAMKQDLKTSAIQVGKALNDPIKGMAALGRTGITFSDSQKAIVKSLVKTGNVIGAQKVILKELETQFGGSARAARNTLGGSLDALANSWGDLFEIAKPASDGLAKSVLLLVKAVENPAFVGFVQTIGTILFAALGLATDALRGLVSILPTAAKLATVAGAGLLAMATPAILSGVVTLTVAIGVGLVGAIKSVAAAMLANPLGALVVGITIALAAVYQFRDKIKQALGVDVVATAKTAANTIIGAFVGAYNSVVATWSMLPGAFGDLVLQATNKMIKGLESLINKSIDGINSLANAVNGPLSKVGVNIGKVGKVSLGGVDNPYAGAASGVSDAIKAEMSKALSTDYLSSANEEMKRRMKGPLIITGGGKADDKVDEEINTVKSLGGAHTKAAKKVKDAWEGARAIFNGFTSDLVAGIRKGEGVWESFKNAGLNALGKISDKLVSLASNKLFDLAFGGAGAKGGTGGLLSKLFGFASGGYTGNGPRNAAAGIVHGQEYVMNATATSQNRPALEAMNSGRRIPPPMAPPANQNVHVHITASGSIDKNGDLHTLIDGISQSNATAAAQKVAAAVPGMVDARNNQREVRRIRPQVA